MNENINIQAIQNMYSVAIYAKDVTLRRIERIVAMVQQENSMLIELFSEKFFQELQRQYELKKRFYGIYATDIHKAQKAFEAKTAVLDSKIDAKGQEYKDLLDAANSAFSLLLATLDIKIEEIGRKLQGGDDEKSY